MIEVFITNISDPLQARMLIDRIHSSFKDYKANFDLEDCDRILRVSSTGAVQCSSLIDLLKHYGCTAEILPDIIITGSAGLLERKMLQQIQQL